MDWNCSETTNDEQSPSDAGNDDDETLLTKDDDNTQDRAVAQQTLGSAIASSIEAKIATTSTETTGIETDETTSG